MFLEQAAAIGLMPRERRSNVLGGFADAVSEQVTALITRQVADAVSSSSRSGPNLDDLHSTEPAAPAPLSESPIKALLPTDMHVQWVLECTSRAFALPLGRLPLATYAVTQSTHMLPAGQGPDRASGAFAGNDRLGAQQIDGSSVAQLACEIYRKWLLDPATRPLSLHDDISGTGDQATLRRLVGHMSLIFTPRPEDMGDDAATKVTQHAALCGHVLDTWLSLARRFKHRLHRETWETLLKLLVAAADMLFTANPGSSYEMLGRHLHGHVLRVLFEVWLLAHTHSALLWKTLKTLASSHWINSSAMVTHWNALCEGLSECMLKLAFSGKAGISSGAADTDTRSDTVVAGTQSTETSTVFIKLGPGLDLEVVCANDYIPFAWHQFLHVLGDPNAISNPRVFADVMRGIARLTHMFLVFETTGARFEQNVAKSDMHSISGNTILHAFGRWLFQAAQLRRGKFETGTAIALSTLCTIFRLRRFDYCFENDDPSKGVRRSGFEPAYLAGFYQVVSEAISLLDGGRLYSAVLVGCQHIFTWELPGANVVLPFFICACARELGTEHSQNSSHGSSPSDLEAGAIPPAKLRESAMVILSTMVSFAGHFGAGKLTCRLPRDVLVRAESFIHGTGASKSSPLPEPVSYGALNSWISACLLRGLKIENNAQNVCRLLWIIVVFMCELARAAVTENVRGPRRSPALPLPSKPKEQRTAKEELNWFAKIVIELIITKLKASVVMWPTGASLAAFDALGSIARLVFFAPENYHQELDGQSDNGRLVQIVSSPAVSQTGAGATTAYAREFVSGHAKDTQPFSAELLNTLPATVVTALATFIFDQVTHEVPTADTEQLLCRALSTLVDWFAGAPPQHALLIAEGAQSDADGLNEDSLTPWLLQRRHSHVLGVVLKAVIAARGLGRGSTLSGPQAQPSSVLKAAHFALLQVMTAVGHFPTATGLRKTSSLVTEHALLTCVRETLGDFSDTSFHNTKQYLRYFALGDESIVALIDLPSISSFRRGRDSGADSTAARVDGPGVACIVRDATGRNTWIAEIQMLGAGAARDFGVTSITPLSETIPALADEQIHSMDDKAFGDLLTFLNSQKDAQEISFSEQAAKQMAVEESMVGQNELYLRTAVAVAPPDPGRSRDAVFSGPTKNHMSRMLLSHMGWLQPRAPLSLLSGAFQSVHDVQKLERGASTSNIPDPAAIEARKNLSFIPDRVQPQPPRAIELRQTSNFFDDLRFLDGISERRTMSVGIVARCGSFNGRFGPRDSSTNDHEYKDADVIKCAPQGGSLARISTEYADFVRSLGWGVNTATHPGFCGTLRDFASGTYSGGMIFPYWADARTEIAYVCAQLIPDNPQTDGSDFHAVKWRMLSRCPVLIVWLEDGQSNESGTSTGHTTVGLECYDQDPVAARAAVPIHIVVHPLPRQRGLYEIQVRSVMGDSSTNARGPLLNHMLVRKEVVGQLVRETALQMQQAIESQDSKFTSLELAGEPSIVRFPYSKRQAQIRAMIRKHRMDAGSEIAGNNKNFVSASNAQDAAALSSLFVPLDEDVRIGYTRENTSQEGRTRAYVTSPAYLQEGRPAGVRPVPPAVNPVPCRSGGDSAASSVSEPSKPQSPARSSPPVMRAAPQAMPHPQTTSSDHVTDASASLPSGTSSSMSSSVSSDVSSGVSSGVSSVSAPQVAPVSASRNANSPTWTRSGAVPKRAFGAFAARAGAASSPRAFGSPQTASPKVPQSYETTGITIDRRGSAVNTNRVEPTYALLPSPKRGLQTDAHASANRVEPNYSALPSPKRAFR